MPKRKPLKTAGFKIVSKPGPPNIRTTLFRLAHSQAHEDLLEEEYIATLTGKKLDCWQHRYTAW
jgi:hypothetical protein